MRRSRGFTLIEMVTAIAVVGALAVTSVWAGQRFVASSRAAGAARTFSLELRNAAAIAARLNRPLQLIVDSAGSAGCNPSWRTQTIPNVGEQPTVYSQTCLNAEYPGILLGNAGVTAAVTCTKDAGTAQPALTNCSLCTGTAAITVYPSGEVKTPGAVPNGATIIFSPSLTNHPTATIAVGVRDSSGQMRIYRPNAAGTSWECP